MTGHEVPHGTQDAVQLWACRVRGQRIFPDLWHQELIVVGSMNIEFCLRYISWTYMFTHHII